MSGYYWIFQIFCGFVLKCILCNVNCNCNRSKSYQQNFNLTVKSQEWPNAKPDIESIVSTHQYDWVFNHQKYWQFTYEIFFIISIIHLNKTNWVSFENSIPWPYWNYPDLFIHIFIHSRTPNIKFYLFFSTLSTKQIKWKMFLQLKSSWEFVFTLQTIWTKGEIANY